MLLLCSRIEDLDVLKGMLAEVGIASEVTNSEMPLPGAEFYPKLWVDDADLPVASKVLTAFRKSSAPGSGSWTCASCGEESEGQFTSCWKCGTIRGDAP